MMRIEYRKIDECESCAKSRAAYLAWRQAFFNAKIKLLCKECLLKILQREHEK